MGAASCTATRYFKQGFIGGMGVSQANPLPITSDFGMRTNPKTNNEKVMHYGIDFGIPEGTVIKAPVSGKIIAATVQKDKAGLYVVEEYKNEDGTPFYIFFMHLSQSDFYKGSKRLPYAISEGETIGLSGGTPGSENAGCSTGPHLHLEIRRGSRSPRASTAIDPKYWFLAKHYIQYKGTGKFFNNLDYISGKFGDPNYFCAEDIDGHALINTVQLGSVEKIIHAEEITIPNETEYEDSKSKHKPGATERLALGIWQITKILMDADVQNKQVCDSSISLQTGSLINYFNKVCQKPFVEFFGDTFGNQFYWIARRPPFDEKGFERMYNYFTDISEDEILHQNLQWESGDIYSWYQYIPTGDVLGVSEQSFMSPAVFFPEYAAIWGSKPMSVQSLYFNFVFSGWYNANLLKERKSNQNRIAQNMISDFRYMIEANAYKPFSRRGNVTLIGNRNIKRGMLVRFSSGEIFHVDSVAHSYNIGLNSVNRTTTLQLSHGIFEDYMHSKKTDLYGEVSYFNVIDFGDYNIDDITFENYKETISKWKVNANSFAFFLNKNQLKFHQK